MSSGDFSVRRLKGSEVSFTAEARAIQEAAFADVAKVVRLNEVIFFSSRAGDAWMLDPADGFAVCLARDYETRPIPIRETDTKLLIEWNADYRIEGEVFIVVERSGRAYSIMGYPIEMIQRMAREIRGPGGESGPDLLALAARRKTGRNDPCPCGSGRKYKKCCLAKDEAALHGASADGSSSTLVSAADLELLPAEAETKSGPRAPANEFATHELPASDAMSEIKIETILAELLAQPPEDTDWNEVIRDVAESKHPDFPAVFRRIAAAVPHTAETGMAFFYWAAAEAFVRRGMPSLLPEVAAGFKKLGRDGWDPDALVHLEDCLVVEGFAGEALRLAEEFFPIVRAADGLMPETVTEQCSLIFELRVGEALRAASPADVTVAQVAAELRAGIAEGIDADVAQVAAAVIAGQAATRDWTRADFDLVTGDFRDDANWRAYLRFSDMLVRVAQEAGRLESVSAGGVFHELSLLLLSAAEARQRRRKKSKQPGANLLDYLEPEGLEERVVRSCPEIAGEVNIARVRMVLAACGLLARFAARHGVIQASEAVALEKELWRLQGSV